MNIIIKEYTKELIDDAIKFELDLRKEEDFYTYNIDNEYKDRINNSFNNPLFNNAVSYLAYIDNKVVGRIDASFIYSKFDGNKKCYLDWICVLKSYRHQGIAQLLFNKLIDKLKQLKINTLIVLTATNEESINFYNNIKYDKVDEKALWIDIK